MSFAAAARDELDRHGESVTFRRPGSPDVDATVPVKLYELTPRELTGAVQANLRRAIVADLHLTAASWPAPPRKGDQIVQGTRIHTVTAVNTLKDGEETAVHRLTVVF